MHFKFEMLLYSYKGMFKFIHFDNAILRIFSLHEVTFVTERV